MQNTALSVANTREKPENQYDLNVEYVVITNAASTGGSLPEYFQKAGYKTILVFSLDPEGIRAKQIPFEKFDYVIKSGDVEFIEREGADT